MQETKNTHPAPFPIALVERIISSTNANIILDPFMGSGTTALVAKRLARQYIGIEIAKDYVEMAEERINNPNIFQLLLSDNLDNKVQTSIDLFPTTPK